MGTSIYRQHAGLVYAVAGPINRPDRDGRGGAKVSVDFARLRKASPIGYLLPATRKWRDALAPRIQPHALCKLYPRIANLIAAMWEEPEGLKAYFDELLIDRRGGRRGFPPDVARDLRAVRDYVVRNSGTR